MINHYCISCYHASVARDCTLCVRSCVHMYIRVYVSICHLLVVYSDNNWWVLVAMSCDHTSVHWTCWTSEFSLVLHLQQEHCPYLNVSEFLVFPHLVSHNLPNWQSAWLRLFYIHHVARSILLHKSGVPSHKDVSGFLPLQSLPFEPYHLLSPSLVCQLHNPNMADQTVPVTLLHEAQEDSKIKAHVFKELRDQMDKLSIFAGRNPLVCEWTTLVTC